MAGVLRRFGREERPPNGRGPVTAAVRSSAQASSMLGLMAIHSFVIRARDLGSPTALQPEGVIGFLSRQSRLSSSSLPLRLLPRHTVHPDSATSRHSPLGHARPRPCPRAKDQSDSKVPPILSNCGSFETTGCARSETLLNSSPQLAGNGKGQSLQGAHSPIAGRIPDYQGPMQAKRGFHEQGVHSDS